MTSLATADRAGKGRPTRARMSRVLRGTLYVKLAVLVTLLVVTFGFYLRLAAGPLSLDDYSDAVEDALASRIGPGWTVTLGETALELFGAKPAVRTKNLEIRNPAGIAVVRAPYAVVSLSPVSLLTGTISPSEIELRDLQIRGTIAKDGSLSFSSEEVAPGSSTAVEATAPASPPTPDPAQSRPSVVSTAVSSLLEPLVTQTGLIGALDRARVEGARLTLIGPDGRERVAFDRVAATFEHAEAGERRLEVDLVGPRGAWGVRGRVTGGSERRAEIEVDALPLADLMLLTGLSAVPIGSDVTLSGRLTSRSANGRLAQLDGRLDSSRGTLIRTGYPPIVIGRAAAQARWDETRSVLALDLVEVSSEGTDIRLSGDLHRIADSPDWQLSLAGRDMGVAGLTAGDAGFRVRSFDGQVTFADNLVRLDRAELKGDALDLSITGRAVSEPAGLGVTGRLDVRDTDVRRLVRLWPDTMNQPLRSFLATRLSGGTVDELSLVTNFDPINLKAAFSDAPFTDEALDLRFRARKAELSLGDGIPPLRNLTVEGRASGTKVTIASRDGAIVMPDGRSFAFSEGSFVHKNIERPGSLAQVSFRLTGGADAFASFLRTPLLREAGAIELDPATIRGNFDVRFKLPLLPSHIPKPAEMPFSASGSVTGLTVEKLPAQEKLEGANLALTYESGLLALKGEGRLSGAPATFDLQASRGGPAELTVSTVLDEAARGRRSLPVAPALAGPVPVKVAIDLNRKGGTKVEADLSRAAIDGLVPGWTKPANKPGRLTFVLADGETTELRDLILDSAPVQMRGTVSLAPGGGLDRADLTTFKLSPGDDLRVQVDRIANGGYRIALKGNNGDARPILKWISAAPIRTGGKERPDVDVDLALNILTGFNDEAMTSVTGKIGSRSGELRSLQFAGRFRAATVEAQLAKRDAGAPALTVRTNDAGSTLRFLDLYRRMMGGRLTLDGRSGDGIQQGRIVVEDFGLRSEPALARIVSQAATEVTVSSDERGLAPIARSEVDQVLFNKLQADFRRSGSRIDYSDAVIYGPQVGFSLAGFMDQARDRLDMTGTFVPAYALNNVFSQLPVVGVLLGGGRNEGLFAVDFRVTGALSSPTLTVNPLTAIAPGIVRKLFGWMLMPDGAGQQDAPAAAPANRRAVR